MQITIYNRVPRAIGWILCSAGLVLGSILAIGVFTTGGQWWAAPVAFACCVLFGGMLGVAWLNHSPRATASAEGVLAKRFFRTRFYRWKDFIQTGVTWSRIWNRGSSVHQLYDHEIVLLLPGGSKRKKYDVLFFLRNIPYILYLPYREDILMYLLQGYGKPDFFFTNGSDAEDYYTIEEQSD